MTAIFPHALTALDYFVFAAMIGSIIGIIVILRTAPRTTIKTQSRNKLRRTPLFEDGIYRPQRRHK